MKKCSEASTQHLRLTCWHSSNSGKAVYSSLNIILKLLLFMERNPVTTKNQTL